jgi:hypothetical protein
MRQFIKEHPWRLEILPCVMFLLASIAPVVYRSEAVGHTRPSLHEPWINFWASPQPWLMRYGMPLVIMLALWMGQLLRNHEWMRVEQDRKRYNWSAPFCAVVIAAVGVFQAFTVLTNGHGDWVFFAWLAIALAAWPVQSYLERTRKRCAFLPEAASEPNASVVEGINPGEQFYYREDRVGWTDLLMAFAKLAGVPPFVYIWTGSAWTAVATLALLSAVTLPNLTPRVTFVITANHLSARTGLRKMRLAFPEIVSCQAEQLDLCDRPSFCYRAFWEQRLWPPEPAPDVLQYYGLGAPVHGLIVETAKGDKYLLGFRNPEAVAKLMESLLSAARPVEGKP